MNVIEKIKNTNHSYYCSNSNYHVRVGNRGLRTYNTWQDFKSEFLIYIDHDYSHCFRFDIVNNYNDENDGESNAEHSLYLYFMMQRKGNFIPAYIKNLYDEDLEGVNRYLNDCWNYIKGQWIEFANRV